MSIGATVMSQSLLSDTESWLAYGWSRRGGSMVRGGVSYGGLGPVLDVDFTWGGAPQMLYTLVPENVALKKYFSVNTRLSQPMVLGSGHWYSSLTPSVEYFYTNGLIFRPYYNEPRGELTRGVERLYFSAGYSGQMRMARKEFLPRWGVSARVGYVVNPTNRDFRSLWSASLGTWLPGVVRPHSTTLRLAWQQDIGKELFGFQMKEVYPRGAMLETTGTSRRWASGSVDYQLPVWYPEGGWTRVVYFKRVRVNLFADYARWRDFAGKWRPLYSYGGDLILDVSPLRMPATTNVAVKFTLAKPSDRRGVWFNFGLELPL
jgi:hypothetical protein